TAGVPSIECGGGSPPQLEAALRVERLGLIERPEMLSPETETKIPREPASPLVPSGEIDRVTSISLIVDDRDRQFGVMRPRPAVEVVGTDHGEVIVDHNHFGVNVDRLALFVLEVEHGDASGSRR